MEKMKDVDFELSIMTLENYEPEIMERIRKKVFTTIEAGYLIAGIANVLDDLDNDPVGCQKRMNRIEILTNDLMGEEKVEDIL